MKFTSLRDGGIVVTTMLMASTGVSSAGLDCTKVSADGQTFNLWSLRGPHSVSTWREHPPKIVNTTYTIDICRGLKMKGDVSKERQCAQGTRVCALQHLWDPKDEDKEELMGVVPIAGELLDQGGGDLDVKATLLSTSDSDTDSQKKGVRLTLHGGYYPMTGNDRVEQRAIIDFVCDSRDGTEGEWDPEDKYDDDYGDSGKGDNKENIRKREDEGDGKKDKQEESPRSKETQFTRDENPALVFESYGYEGNDEKIQILRMTWHTKAACTRDDTGGDQSKESRSWGFFSWVVILAFLAIASYLIFGSWLNYNRYGARGWDLVPHGDAIRDVPYLLKDWGRRVLNTVQGGGSRGGYSAV